MFLLDLIPANLFSTVVILSVFAVTFPLLNFKNGIKSGAFRTVIGTIGAFLSLGGAFLLMVFCFFEFLSFLASTDIMTRYWGQYDASFLIMNFITSLASLIIHSLCLAITGVVTIKFIQD